MSRKYSIGAPITLSVVAIVLTIAIVVGWNLIFSFYYVLGAETKAADLGIMFWVANAGGNLFMMFVVTTLALLLASTIRRTLLVRRQDTFIDSVTHELKSPLASLRVCLDTMELRELTPAQRKRFEGMMRADVDRLQAFIEHILEAGRLEHNERELRIEPVRIAEHIDACIERIRTRHRVADDTIEVDVQLPEGATFMLDPIALDIVLTNLLDNAIKYSRSPRMVRLTVRLDRARLRIEVTDNGVGIEPREIARVFDRFYRVEDADQPRVRGTGLGLYLVKSVVDRLDGTVTAVSGGRDQGSKFTIQLPHRLQDADP